MREIGQRELRNDNAEIMRRVMAGESFVVTRNGKPVADLVPHQPTRESARPRRTLGEIQRVFRSLPPIDAESWHQELKDADDVFGPDDPLEDPWERSAVRRAEGRSGR